MQVLTTKQVSANPQHQLNARVLNKYPIIMAIITELPSQTVGEKKGYKIQLRQKVTLTPTDS